MILFLLNNSKHFKNLFKLNLHILLFSIIFLSTIILCLFSLFKIPSTPNRKLNIFFTETNKSRGFLTYKQLCSIESAALHNPNANVYLFSLNAKINQQLLNKYKNIKFVLTSENDVYKDTPLFKWWTLQKKKLESGLYKIHDLSDSFRIALVYKYGGFYSDLDSINIKSLESLKNLNAIAHDKIQNKISPSNAVLMFEKKHNFLYSTMINLANNYQTNIWGYNGPKLIERSVKQYCRLDNIYEELVFQVKEEFSGNKNGTAKCDVVILTNEFFFPVHWSQHKILFEKNSTFKISQFKNSYGVHFYGKFSHYYDVRLNDNSIYEFFISQNCPLIYSYLEKKLIDKI